jgi:putative phosphoribosyl transferase
VEAETQRQLAEIERRRRAYRGDAPAPGVAGRTVIVVDDGIATGGTVLAALRALRKAGPLRLVLAVPVAPADTIAALAGECDEIICLAQPTPFYAVGAHYANFNQTSDREVIALLEQASRLKPA